MHFVAAATDFLVLCYDDALSAATATRQVAIVEWTLRGADSDGDRSLRCFVVVVVGLLILCSLTASSLLLLACSVLL